MAGQELLEAPQPGTGPFQQDDLGQGRTAGGHLVEGGEELPGGEDQRRPAVGEDVLEFPRPVEGTGRDGDRSDLHAAEHGDDVLDGVGRPDHEVVAPPHARRRQRVSEAVGERFELGVGDRPLLDVQRRAVPPSLGHGAGDDRASDVHPVGYGQIVLGQPRLTLVHLCLLR